MKHKKVYVLVICLIALFLAMSHITCRTESTTSEKKDVKSKSKPITAYVSKSLTTITIENGDNFDWPSVEIYINGWDVNPIVDSYQYNYGSVRAKETIKIPLIEFTKGTARFQPMNMAVKTLVVYVPGYDGRVHHY
ncbi:MAG: hypothetical protein OEZ20_06830 [candidate division WOR-3 bacterium]|nr:hypothetical protein [candidate division WOR-3 bacterium]